MAKWVS